MKQYNKPVLIAEAGINHSGDYSKLIELSDMALGAGFDYVKVQMRTPRICVPKQEWDVPRQWFDGTQLTYIQYKERMEIGERDLDDWFSRYNGKAFASVWDIPSLERLIKYSPPFIKIPSALITNHELVREAIKTNTPIIASTGMSTGKEIDDLVSLFPKDYALIIMHCNSSYPVHDEEINLNTMETLKNKYNYPAGYSSHDKSPFSCLYAMALGSWGIEAHVTLDRTLPGTDQASSLELPALKLIVRERERLGKIMGNGEIKVYESEMPALKKLRG